ncbi:MAG: hypothetical protein LBC20_11440 [Planctomycetaceae bacterium]|jgi:predicted O-linked N-acetylglucosamine transferase (SPINDLY family)|nr:hypothetical protein [Planctomycetaceae bacterium]
MFSSSLPQQSDVTSLRFFRRAATLAHEEDFSSSAHLYRAASRLPSGKSVWQWKPLGFCPTVFPDVTTLEHYWQRLHSGLDLALSSSISVDWRTLPIDGFFPSFHLPHHNRSCKTVREKFCRIFASAFPHALPPVPINPYNNKGRWRLGFHALHGHEGGFLRGTAGLINALDKKRFDIFVFVPAVSIEHCKRTIKSEGVTFVPLGGSFEAVVEQVRRTSCHLLYYRKVGSDAWSYFFPFARCAPIQVTSYGTHGTSGVNTVDYFLSSTYVEPENGQDYYTEKLFTLNALPTYQPRLPRLATPVSRSEFNLPAHGALYFCPHRTSKYHPGFDPIIKAIAERDPDGHFVLLLGHDEKGRKLLHERLKQNLGETIYKRIYFYSFFPFEKYCRLLSLATCLLDSPVYAGGLTSFDAFSYGIPEVTLSGSLHVQNFTTGIYRRMGLEHLPCATLNEYLDRAVRLGTEPEYRHSVSLDIESRSNTIFGTPEVISEHERFFESVCNELRL